MKLLASKMIFILRGKREREKKGKKEINNGKYNWRNNFHVIYVDVLRYSLGDDSRSTWKYLTEISVPCVGKWPN